MAGLPLHFHPGEDYSYSMGLDVLGYFIEVVSGMPLDRFLKERIFDPLGMKDTWFYLPPEKEQRLVPVQTTGGQGQWVRHQGEFYDSDYPVSGARSFFSGGAGLVSTARDYAAFLQMYLNKGELNGVRILSRPTVDLIMTNQTEGMDSWQDPGRHVGLAFGVANETGRKLGEYGNVGTFDWGGFFDTYAFADSAENIIGILLKQLRETPSDPTRWQFRQITGASVTD